MAKAKKSSSNAVSKIDKQIKELEKSISKPEEKENIPIMNKKEIDKIIKDTSKKSSTNSKKEQIVVVEGKKTNAKKKTTKKKETIVAPSRPKTTNSKKKKNTKKKENIIVAPEKKKQIKKPPYKKPIIKEKVIDIDSKEDEVIPVKEKEEVKEDIIKPIEGTVLTKEEKKEDKEKITSFENKIRTLYDRVNDVIEDIEYTKEINIVDNLVVADTIDKSKREEKINLFEFNKTIKILGIVFLILLIFFIIFIIYVCTF